MTETALLALPDGGRLAVAIDDHTDAWRTPSTVLMLHGIAERGEVWGPWAPTLSRRHRVLRPDLRGFGKSSALPSERDFALSDWADDLEILLRECGTGAVHIVASKLGALVAFELARRQPAWLKSMTLAGMLASPAGALGPWIDEWCAQVMQDGVVGWARATMPGRMGASLPPEAMAWWTQLMGEAPAATVLHCFRMLPGIPQPPEPERVACPALFILAAGAHQPADAYDQRPLPADMLRLQARVRGSSVAWVEADSYHIAATHPDACARIAAGFIDALDQNGDTNP